MRKYCWLIIYTLLLSTLALIASAYAVRHPGEVPPHLFLFVSFWFLGLERIKLGELGLLYYYRIANAVSIKCAPLKKPDGIGGWLAFFIAISLGITLFSLFWVRSLSLKAINDTPEIKTGTFAYMSIAILFDLFCLYALYCLYRIRPGAVGLVKKLLIFNCVYTALAPALFLVCVELSGSYSSSVLTQNNVHHFYGSSAKMRILCSLVYAAIWYPYFTWSERVKNAWNTQSAQVPAWPSASAAECRVMPQVMPGDQ